ncbi:MAG: hypothetical protein AAFZ52_19170, partial [Bacteroidota bacterium]
ASRKEYGAEAVFQRAQRFVMLIVSVTAGLFLIVSPTIANWLEYPDRTIYVQLVLATAVFDALSAVPLARLRLEQRPWFFVFVNLGNVLLNLGLIFWLLYLWPQQKTLFGWEYLPEYQVGYYLITLAVAAGFRYLALLLDGIFRARRSPKENLPAPPLRRMLHYSLPLTLVGVAGIINALFGPSFIKFYYGETVTGNLYWSGQFNAALKLAVFLNLVVTAYQYAAEPFFFRQAGKDPAVADKQIYADATRAYALVGSLACAAILLLLPWLQYFIDEGEREGLFVLPLLLAGNFCFGLYANFAIAYKLTDKTYLGGAIALVGSVLAIGTGVVFIEDYGIYAPAAGMLVCYTVMCFLGWLVSRRYFPVAYPLGRILGYVLLASATIYWARTQDAMFVRIAALLALTTALLVIEWPWIRRTFLGRA